MRTIIKRMIGRVKGEPLLPFTVVKDWDGSHGSGIELAPVYHVWGADKIDAFHAADDAAQEEFGDDAEHLYGVAIFEGHAVQV